MLPECSRNRDRIADQENGNRQENTDNHHGQNTNYLIDAGNSFRRGAGIVHPSDNVLTLQPGNKFLLIFQIIQENIVRSRVGKRIVVTEAFRQIHLILSEIITLYLFPCFLGRLELDLFYFRSCFQSLAELGNCLIRCTFIKKYGDSHRAFRILNHILHIDYDGKEQAKQKNTRRNRRDRSKRKQNISAYIIYALFQAIPKCTNPHVYIRPFSRRLRWFHDPW